MTGSTTRHGTFDRVGWVERVEHVGHGQQNSGNARLAVGQLHVYPQTVRYRLRQIQELSGPVLAEPGARFELEVALRARARPGARNAPEWH